MMKVSLNIVNLKKVNFKKVNFVQYDVMNQRDAVANRIRNYFEKERAALRLAGTKTEGYAEKMRALYKTEELFLKNLDLVQ
jgi:hypothetical protein